MTQTAALPLRRVLGLRLAGAGMAGLLALVSVLGVVYSVQRERIGQRWLEDARAHFERQTRRLDADWQRQADLLRGQIEFSGVLDGADEGVSKARFTAFLASMGGQGTFTHVIVLDAAGRSVVSYATRSGAPVLPGDRSAVSWHFSEVDRLLYRAIRAPLRLGSRGRGELVVMAPLNNALLDAIAFPDTQISLRWNGQPDLSMSGTIGASAPASTAPARLDADFAWGGDPPGPDLHVSRRVLEVLPLGELLPLAAAGMLGGALLAWLAIGRWARAHVRRIDMLVSAMEAFASGRRRANELSAQVRAATNDADAELRRLGDGLGAMMDATEAADSEKAVANAGLAELNRTLEQRVAERTHELAVARDEALAAARAKQQILAGVSHELRTPLVGLLGSLELADLERVPPEQRRLFEVARRSGQALRNVVDDVLDYSRLEAVGAELRSLPFRADDLATEAASLHAAVALNKGVHLSCRCSDATAHLVRGDPARLRQVLLNLIGNAVKFTDRGTVELSVDAAPVSRGDGLQLRFAVRDTGIGIDEASQARLFTPFAQVDGARAQARGGTGLGLAIAQRLVAAMGSHIRVESQPGTGSTFSFEIEMPLAESGVTTSPATTIAGLLHGRVLLVEDNPVNRVITTEMLRRLGLDVEEAENGLLAIEALQRRRADLVLMDQQMPVLDGLEATARIRSCEAGADAAQVPIVAITANAQEGDAERCLDAGMNDYLAKPFTQVELAATLRRWLRTR